MLTDGKWKTEIIGGLTTFFTMSYIVIVNPSILSTPGTGMSFSGVLTATVILAFLMTLLMGLYAKLPFAVAPGLGINAYFVFSLILGQHIPWPVALGMIFWAGVFFILISATKARESIAKAIPHHLRSASATGIGLFLTFIGLKNMGLIVANPATLVSIGKINIESGIGLFSLLVIVWFFRRKNPFAILIGVGLGTILSLIVGKVQMPAQLFSAPDFQSVFFKLDIMGALKLSYMPAILSIMFTDLFDSLSTFIGVSQATGLLDEKGEPLHLRKGLLVDAMATMGAGLLGTSSGTAFIESSAGIEAGGRTGKSAIVTAFCFLPCLFLAPIVGIIPGFATGPALVLVGALMFRSIKDLELGNLEDLIPAFLTLILIPLTFSITQGMLWGFISHTLLYLLFGRRKELSPTMFTIAIASVILIMIENS